jgi:hypothetical protein
MLRVYEWQYERWRKSLNRTGKEILFHLRLAARS